MKLFVIVVCLFCERYLIHYIAYQRFFWFNDYARSIFNWISNIPVMNNPWIKLLSLVLPPVALFALVYFMLCQVLYGFLGLVLSIFFLYYCLGPQNVFYPLVAGEDHPSETDRIMAYLSQINSQVFSLLFWYLVGGPILALAYRLITLSTRIEDTRNPATQLSDYLEWIPARMVMLLFLIVGNFQKGALYFSSVLFSKPSMNNEVISECGLLALQSSESDDLNLSSAESFVEYALLVFLVSIALFTLAAWI